MVSRDAIVLGAGIVGTSIALHLAKRGLGVALIDRRAPGEETSYGNAGVIEGNTIFPPAFPSDPIALLRVALKRAPEANYHLSFLPQVAPWLMKFRAGSQPQRLIETARAMRPLFARAFEALKSELALAQEFGIPYRALDTDGARELEPSLAPVFPHAVYWERAASLTNPLAVTQAYATRFSALGGVVMRADARALRRVNAHWRLETPEGPIDADHAVVALGPFAPDLLDPLGIALPLGFKRGYHHHYRGTGNAALSRPVVDIENGYCLAPMEQGIRLTTGAEFAARDAPPTPVQFERLLPAARKLFPLGAPLEASPWMGSRPCFPDSRPVVGPAPGQRGLWLAYGHAHWGLTLSAATGRLVAEMMTGATPFCDPAPYSAERFRR
jgi:D-amino-acid dehydrogenase